MIRFCIRWLVMRSVRRAVELRKMVIKITRAQQDLLKPEDVKAVRETCAGLLEAINADEFDKLKLQAAVTAVEKVANKFLKPYPNATMRENVEVVLVAVAVAMGIRTFVLQPFKIPTGSMQPTLYGITHEDYRNREDVVFPTGAAAWFDRIFRGVKYIHIVAEQGGYLEEVEPLTKVMKFRNRQRFKVGGVWYSASGLHDEIIGGKYNRAGLRGDMYFEKGEDIVKLKVISGDHLFVDRLSYNFIRPSRGDIVVFATMGIEHPDVPQNQFYIKRLIATGSEKVRISDDRHVWIDDERLDASTYRFENVYAFDSEMAPQDSLHSGHLNGSYAYRLAPLFPDNDRGVQVRPNHILAMGDNTVNSLDSRAWGDVTQTNVIGRSAFVYWPVLGNGDRQSRFGWSHR